MKKIFVSLFLILNNIFFAQPITVTPTFPTVNDSIKITFNAALAERKDLIGYTGTLYAHTGLITSESTNGDDWKNVIGSWGNNSTQPALTKIAGDLYELVIGFPKTFYNVNQNTVIKQLAFVFRSSDESKQTENIYIDLYEPGITMQLISPQTDAEYGDPLRNPVFANYQDTVTISAAAVTLGTEISKISIYLNNTIFSETENDTINFDLITNELEEGIYPVSIIGIDTSGISDTVSFAIVINPEITNDPPSFDLTHGIIINNDNSVTLTLFAPNKEFVYLVGDFNDSDWRIDYSLKMNRYEPKEDSTLFWIRLDNLVAGKEYRYQYLVDGQIRIPDPYAEKLLDPWNDKFIDESTYPNLIDYPDGKTSEFVSIVQTAKEEYIWQADNYQKPEKKNLIIYELLLRDFLEEHDYKTLIDTLDYLENLGINAIELMPVNEFEGNISWGYNPAFYFAPDKYYGPANDLKRFIDECHKRNIAVIIDMVLNHSFGQSPMVRLYNEGGYGRPTPDNPWFNVTARHPFNVGYDFNHESIHTKYFVDRVNQFWIEEYKVDGFRFDLSKGFTQKNSGSNVGLWGQYDQSRIDILKRMADKIWSVDPTNYVILEHFADNSEERVLESYGMLLWGNMNTAYSQSAMGWLQDASMSSDLGWGYYKTRSWTNPHLITYMESHDEQWMMFKNLAYGRSSGNYNVKDLRTALNRIKLAAAFLFTTPGPKMMWQFGELGYDEELTESGRTDPKPIKWEYYDDPDRLKLYKTFSAILKLRNENEVFSSEETIVNQRVGQGQYDRRINLSHPSMNATIIGNFNVSSMTVVPNFQSTGIWYEYFTGDSIDVTDTQAGIELFPGEFRIYTSKKLQSPEPDLVTDVNDEIFSLPQDFNLFQNYPNPFNPKTKIRFSIPAAAGSNLVTLKIYDILGNEITTLVNEGLSPGTYEKEFNASELASGIYIYRLNAGNFNSAKKLTLLK